MKNRKKTTAIVVHHTAGPTSQTLEDIRRFHVEGRGFSDIGYNVLVHVQDGYWRWDEARGWDAVGAHCKGHNSTTVGVAIAGQWSPDAPNYEGYPPWDRAGWFLLLEAVAVAMERYGLQPFNVHGHGDMSGQNTLCCGFPISKLRKDLHRLARVRWHTRTLNALSAR